MSPVDTGGMTKGNRTMVSTTLLKGHSFRAKSQASATPNGRITIVLAMPTAKEKIVICQVSREKITDAFVFAALIENHKAEFLEDRFAGRAQ